MAFYESTFIVRQDASTQDVEKLTESFEQAIEAEKGKVVKKEFWGLRSLAYKIKKNKKGHYVLLCLDAPAAAVNEFDRKCKISEDVIRHLTIRVEGHSDEPSPVLRKDER